MKRKGEGKESENESMMKLKGNVKEKGQETGKEKRKGTGKRK